MPTVAFDWKLFSVLFWLSEWLLRLLAILWIPQRRTPAAAKVWLLLIFFLPWVGFVLYWLLGNVSLKQVRSKKREKLLRQWAERVNRDTGLHAELPANRREALEQAVRLAENLGRMPILGGNQAELLTDYDGALDRLVADIDAAAHSVHLLYYIFEADHVGRKLADALVRAERRGVQCRLLVDAIGSRAARRRLLPELRRAKVEAFEMLPVGLFAKRLARLDVRNHRKLAIVDGRVGYIGSQNITNATFKPGIVYEELVARVTGPVIASFQSVFADDWYLTTGRSLGQDAFPEVPTTGNVYCQLLPSGPGYATENNQRLFVALIHGARKRVVITTPYFIPDESLLQAMQTAVLRGVEVHLVTSAKPDQLLVGLAQTSYYDELLDYGVRVHLYEERFLHAKHLTVDDGVAVVGSSNMDLRSFALNLELSQILYDPAVTAELRRIQERYFAGSQLLTKQAWRARGPGRKAAQNIARLFSPLL